MRRWVLVLVIAVLHSSSAFAEIFRWVDEAGKLHFAQSLQQVPARFRAQLREASPVENAGHFQTYSSRIDSGAASSSRTYRIPFQYDGSLMRVNATLNDHLSVPFLIDTGASGISLPASTAQKLGITVGPDTQWITVRTANGAIRVPLVRLDSVVLGGARVEGLMATLNPTTSFGLLGGSFFNNFNYQVDPAASMITLKPNHISQPSMGEGYWRGRFGRIYDSLEELEDYLRDNEEGLRASRRESLENKREELQAKLDELQLEANRDNVPRAWRQ